MSSADPISRRYSSGEDVGPLVRALSGALLGTAAALLVDVAVPSAAPGNLVWPALMGAAAGEPLRTGLGSVLGLSVASLTALAFVYGQFRRFVPGPARLAGVTWSIGIWLVAGPLLLPLAVGWDEFAGGAGTGVPLLPALGLFVETAIGVALYGAVVGHLNPPRET
jgi:hypothetical protein